MKTKFVFGLAGTLLALVLTGCITEAEYEFENQTSYSITVTVVGTSFQIWSESSGDFVDYSYTYINLYSGNKIKIKTNTDIVDFEWTSGSYNSKIYVDNKGNKVIFKE
ncbi:MAG: hypothetical protein LBQ88_09590 [Treponema sp.]|jgi:hypothetical protein|nr:hypothetical protein [Treponema sp.]